jgi:hypothetical protein
MFAHPSQCASALRGWRTLRCSKLLLPAGLCLLLLAGCATAPPAPVSGVHPANHEVGARPASYRPVIRPYQSQRPRDPGGWRENNERVAPQEKP